ncbi:pyridoxal phosphate-dependent aminotransferase [Ketobacter sp.]|uniref:pyridoxal phosphate-dependent aminotransferase n=1 Tax=Ketobacter sp. TaxID=2083498 RepID=UPI0025BE5853|nr:pyridoxal phosphate-dependent aminotransferase [Ketobacter sp.]
MAALRKLADRLERITSFHVMVLMEQAQQLEQQGRDIIHLEVGEPDFATPQNVVAAGVDAMQAGKTRYTTALGLPALRQAIADFYQSRFGVEVPASRILITPGASGALGLLNTLLFNPGDGVLLSDPGYPCNDNFLHQVGALPQRIAVGAESAYQLSAELVRQHWQPHTRGAWVASPSNPTGTLIPMAEMAAMKAEVDARGGALLVDEIYHNLVYEQPPATALALADEQDSLFVINSFSKYFNMTGWRLGWLVAPQQHVAALEKLAQNYYLAASTVAQHAALAAFSAQSIALYEERRIILGQRRDFLLERLPGLGISIPCTPQGAFYLYCDVSAITDDSFALCQQLLHRCGVAVTPGIDFGVHQAQRYIRIAYSASLERLQEAVDRIARFIGR